MWTKSVYHVLPLSSATFPTGRYTATIWLSSPSYLHSSQYASVHEQAVIYNSKKILKYFSHCRYIYMLPSEQYFWLLESANSFWNVFWRFFHQYCYLFISYSSYIDFKFYKFASIPSFIHTIRKNICMQCLFTENRRNGYLRDIISSRSS